MTSDLMMLFSMMLGSMNDVIAAGREHQSTNQAAPALIQMAMNRYYFRSLLILSNLPTAIIRQENIMLPNDDPKQSFQFFCCNC